MSLGDERETSGGYGGTGQTRTRLPESSGDVYGGARRGGRSSSRSLVTVVGVVVLLIAAIAFANRGGDDSASPNGDENQPNSSTTAASGTRPVDGKSAGIPGGFARDEQGAQSAAANYAVTLGSTGMFNKESRHGIVDTIYTATAATKLQGAMDQAYTADFLSKLGLDADGNAPEGSTFVSRTVPVGTTVDQYSQSRAKVSVWYMGLIGMSGQGSTDPVSSTWKTWTFDLQWVNGDWKITADTQKDGPAPVPGDDRAASSDEISKAIEEYGGFTYAR
ncbi:MULTISPECIES: hypothetical protein [Streptomyces]|uniref:hypothetical protein n=1 Tax=Streptomyces TaxID=1883 RepID=UPI00123CB538|nr:MULTISPECIES: hypothetical protein [Streptomyces]MBT1094708.1 hypothetical protein [Streptomyces sp. Tu102]QEV69191.1 hypothetical protein CP983_22725 [Streptomyces chartreusis]GGX19855.1 hypothetical protein GCM10010321_38200 [Streptomyces chartreusis]